MDDVLCVKDLSFSYGEGLPNALCNISFTIKEGSYTTIIGHNGSGKSTLAKVLAGLLEYPQGEVKIFDQKLDRDSVSKIRSRLGLVFQNPDNQFVGSSVRDDIAFGLENRAVDPQKMEEIISYYAKEVGMENFLDSAPENLSGGQKQRVAIAGVLAMHPDIIIFDEATSMLDPLGKKEIFDITFKMRKANPKLTVISITHDVEEAYQADEVFVMNEGKIVLQGSPKDVFKEEETLKNIHLDIPFVLSLKNALKEQGIVAANEANSEEELVEFLCR